MRREPGRPVAAPERRREGNLRDEPDDLGATREELGPGRHQIAPPQLHLTAEPTVCASEISARSPGWP
jgi:hypothetical protein